MRARRSDCRPGKREAERLDADALALNGDMPHYAAGLPPAPILRTAQDQDTADRHGGCASGCPIDQPENLIRSPAAITS